MKISPNDLCPCGSKLKYKKCCRALHNGVPAPTPEALMRSRYCAYALDNVEYIMQTTHPEGPHYQANREKWRQELQAFSRGTHFNGLEILAVDGDTVTFHASLSNASGDVSFTECSLFTKIEDRWMYFKGEHK